MADRSHGWVQWTEQWLLVGSLLRPQQPLAPTVEVSLYVVVFVKALAGFHMAMRTESKVPEADMFTQRRPTGALLHSYFEISVASGKQTFPLSSITQGVSGTGSLLSSVSISLLM